MRLMKLKLQGSSVAQTPPGPNFIFVFLRRSPKLHTLWDQQNLCHLWLKIHKIVTILLSHCCRVVEQRLDPCNWWPAEGTESRTQQRTESRIGGCFLNTMVPTLKSFTLFLGSNLQGFYLPLIVSTIVLSHYN